MPVVRADPGIHGILVEDRSRRPDRFELRVLYPNQPFAVRKALSSVMGGLSGLGLTADESSNVEIVLAEVLNNVAEHAYEDDPTGLVELTVRRQAEHLCFTVVDEGRPMPEGQIPRTCAPDPDTAERELPEGGFGWFLIRTLACNLRYTRCHGSNRVSFDMHFDRRLREV